MLGGDLNPLPRSFCAHPLRDRVRRSSRQGAYSQISQIDSPAAVAVIQSRWQMPGFPTAAGVFLPAYPRQDWQTSAGNGLVPATGTFQNMFR